MKTKPATKKPAKVTKIIKTHTFKDQKLEQVEKVQIELRDGEHLYREVRIENELEDESGKKVKLKPNAEVEVTIEADPDQTTVK